MSHLTKKNKHTLRLSVIADSVFSSSENYYSEMTSTRADNKPLTEEKHSHDMKSIVFWNVTPLGSSKNRRFGRTYSFHHHVGKNRRDRNSVSSN
jgi:hypothetical protein